MVSPIGLFVLLGCLLSDDELLALYSAAEGAGPRLDPENDDQTTKLEEVVLDQLTRRGLALNEFLSVEWVDAEQRGTVNLLMANFVGQTRSHTLVSIGGDRRQVRSS